jgi:hypothetical protein
MAGKGIQQFTVQEAQNVGLGQLGSIFLDTATAIAPPSGCVFVAITFLGDTTLNASGGLIGENQDLFPNTAAAAHDFGSGLATTVEGEGGVAIDASNTFPKGATIYGRWTSIKPTSTEPLIAYIGK